jgi:hypothetical protein
LILSHSFPRSSPGIIEAGEGKPMFPALRTLEMKDMRIFDEVEEDLQVGNSMKGIDYIKYDALAWHKEKLLRQRMRFLNVGHKNRYRLAHLSTCGRRLDATYFEQLKEESYTGCPFFVGPISLYGFHV